MTDFRSIADFIWGIADLIRDAFSRGKYQDVILPFTVLRRVDSVLEPTKDRVLAANAKLSGKIQNVYAQLCRASGYAFYNTSRYTLSSLLDDPHNVAHNLRNYLNGFSDNMREVMDRFRLESTINGLQEAGLLYLVLQRFADADLHPDRVDNHMMGQVFEDLIRRFNEALNENPGQHFTPRDAIRLMVNLVLAGDREALRQNHIVRTVYDPCCGSGGMLTIAKEHILQLNPQAEVHLFGQEVNPETWAVSVADLLMTSEKGRDAANIRFGSTLSSDQLSDRGYDYLLANPPYGKDWRGDERAVRAEAARGHAGRFGAGLPRINDGQMLFLQHMLSRMRPPEDGGSRVAIVMNGSPLFSGDAGSGESEIRRWVLENDWLETIVALPEQIFHNTGIATYVWVLTNHKAKRRQCRVQLIDASSLWAPMSKSLGDKRRQLTPEHIREIAEMYRSFSDSGPCRVFDREDFGYRKITVERPLRLNFQATPERIARVKLESAFAGLAASRKKDAEAKEADEVLGRELQAKIMAMLETLPNTLFMDRPPFVKLLNAAARAAEVQLTAPLRKAILSALSERDEKAEICRDQADRPEPDPELRDTENVPLKESIYDFFAREVAPHVPDAWINESVCDPQDGKVGKVGYEVSFNRYFYQYQPPRPLEEIEADIRAVEQDILTMLREVAG